MTILLNKPYLVKVSIRGMGVKNPVNLSAWFVHSSHLLLFIMILHYVLRDFAQCFGTKYRKKIFLKLSKQVDMMTFSGHKARTIE